MYDHMNNSIYNFLYVGYQHVFFRCPCQFPHQLLLLKCPNLLLLAMTRLSIPI